MLALAVLAAVTVLAPTAPTAEQPQEYIVVLKSSFKGSAATVAAQRAGAVHGSPGFVFEHALKGFTLRLTPTLAAQLPQLDARVAYVERDAPVHALVSQSSAPWGLDRIDQRTLPLSTTYNYTATGAGVTAYIVDTGIRYTHTQFGGRAVFGFDSFGGTGADCHGHGTHVAGTVGGATYGVAKSVNLIGVRVLDCAGNGTNAGVIAGVDWVTAHHAAGAPAVANMSLGGAASAALDAAVANSIADGVTYAVAAGNGNIFGIGVNACNSSPARVPAALTISATDSNDRKAAFCELRRLRRLVRAGRLDPLGLVDEQHRDEHDQRHVDGDSAHGGRRRALSPGSARRFAGGYTRGTLRCDDEEHRHLVEHGEQPPALHRRRRPRRATATARAGLLQRLRRRR